MKRTWLLSVLFLFGLSVLAPAQTSVERAKASADILTSIKKLDMLNQILPVLMTKDQLRKVLSAVETARKNAKDLEAKELEVMKEINPKIQAALTEALKNKKVPSQELLSDVSKMFTKFRVARKLMVELNVAQTTEALEKNLDEGQRRAAANALDPRVFDPEEEKLKLWVQFVLLDATSYEVLVELAK